MQTSTTGRELITKFEGCILKAYWCPAGILTIGIGHTSADGSPTVAAGMIITRDEADTILARDLLSFEDSVTRLVKVPLNQNQFDALISFTFNLGAGALKGSTLLRKLNAGDYAGAASEFAKWNKAGGKVLAGLTRRRTAEAELFRAATKPVESPKPNPTTPVATTTSTRPTGLLAAILGQFRKA